MGAKCPECESSLNHDCEQVDAEVRRLAAENRRLENVTTDLLGVRDTLRARVAELEEILLRLSNMEPTMTVSEEMDHPAITQCHFCGAETFYGKEPHYEGCIWLNAGDAVRGGK